MCGIAGLFHFNGEPANAERLRPAITRLAHRGPDDSGIHLDGPCAIGHTRLSIIDLDSGHQPLFAADGQLALVANGEIYNHLELRAELEGQGHRFATHSDSEVILHAYLEYGLEGCLQRLCGMFAFALYDARRRELVLARDRLGIKPLFVAALPDGIAFASEIKALLPLLPGRPQVAAAGLAEYLEHGFSGGRRTLFAGVERLLPAEAVTYGVDTPPRPLHYWSAAAVEPLAIDYPEAEARFDALMETVMHQHMRSDVPFGLFLSGGVDSSTVLALLSRYGAGAIRTYSVGFPDTGITDELPLARIMAERFGSDHHELAPDSRAMLHRLPFTVWAADELMRDNATLPTALLAEETGRQLKVVFSGEGGDEVFAGYRRFYRHPLQQRLLALFPRGTGGYRTRGTYSSSRWKRPLLGPALRAALAQARAPFLDAWAACPPGWSALQRKQFIELRASMPDNLLVKVDRMLMASGVEGRVPFLDHRVVEFGLALPDALKMEGPRGKLFLKRWASRYLPEELLHARKRGFRVPVGEWFSGAFLDRLERSLPGHPAIAEWFHPEAVRRLIALQRGRNRYSHFLMPLLQFAIWHRLFITGDGSAPPREADPLELLE